MSTTDETARGKVIHLNNGTAIELLITGHELVGIGSVTVDGVVLRSSRVPLVPILKSTRGVIYARFYLEKVRAWDDTVAIYTTAVGQPVLEGVYGDEYNDLLLWPSENTQKRKSTIVWLLQSETLQLHDVAYTGFSYVWKFSSPNEKIHRIIAQTTWELGGAAEGNTLLSLGQVTPPVYTAEKDTHFTSACLKQLNRFGDPEGMSFQWSPRYSPQQCFDFEAGPSGSMVGYWPELGDVKSFVQKNPGEDVIFFMDATYFTAAREVETPRKCILFAPAGPEGMPDHTMRNRWKDAYDFCQESARKQYGVKRSRPLPETTIGYGQRLDENGKLTLRVGDQWVPSQEWLIAMADTFFPELASRGIRRIIPEPIVQTDPTERGMIKKLDTGIHGDLILGSVCSVHRYVPAEFWGGEKAWRYYYEKAHQSGLEVGHWIGPHLAWHAPILAEHPEWALRGMNTQTYSGGYPSFGLAALNWNTPVRRWIFEDLKRWKEELGLDYVWFDSIGNLGFLPVDYSQQMQSNATAIVEFIANLQGIGIQNIAVEGTSPFGISSCGLFDPNQGSVRDAQDIVGQNTLDWYVGNEDMLCDQAPRIELHRDRSEEESRQIFFRCLANRCTPMLGRFSRGFGPKPSWFKAYLDSYFAVEDLLERRCLLPDNQGVSWTSEKGQALFTYKPFLCVLKEGQKPVLIDAGRSDPSIVNGSNFTTHAWSIYRIDY